MRLISIVLFLEFVGILSAEVPTTAGAAAASPQWLAAGKLALSRSAYAEADRYVDSGFGFDPAPTPGD
jgi:hypothetical protein